MILHKIYRALIMLSLLVPSFLFAQEKNKPKIFLEKFKSHLGNYYEGEIVAGGKAGDGFTGEKLLMQVLSYTDSEVRIPFYVGNNKSRTWILSYSNNVLSLKHDHRHKDGSADRITFYGGTSPNQGSDIIQIFPADNETCQLIDFACQNVWWVTMEGDIFTYNLRKIGSERLFTIKFDLTKSVKSNFVPW